MSSQRCAHHISAAADAASLGDCPGCNERSGLDSERNAPATSLRAPSGVMYSMTPGPPMLCDSGPAWPTERCSAVRQDDTSSAPPLCACLASPVLLCPETLHPV